MEAQQNHALLAGHFATIDNATHLLTADGLRPNYYHWVAKARRKAAQVRSASWFGF